VALQERRQFLPARLTPITVRFAFNRTARAPCAVDPKALSIPRRPARCSRPAGYPRKDDKRFAPAFTDMAVSPVNAIAKSVAALGRLVVTADNAGHSTLRRA
jgi:hypothetical protein